MGIFCSKDDALDNDLTKHSDELINKYKKRLYLLYHCKNCESEYPNNMCKKYGRDCAIVKELIKHLPYCKDDKCNIKYCKKFKIILKHFASCQNFDCVICKDVLSKMEYKNKKKNRKEENIKFIRSNNFYKFKPKNDCLSIAQSY